MCNLPVSKLLLHIGADLLLLGQLSLQLQVSSVHDLQCFNIFRFGRPLLVQVLQLFVLAVEQLQPIVVLLFERHQFLFHVVSECLHLGEVD